MENVLCIDIGTGFSKAAIIYPGMKEPLLLIPPEMPMGMSSVAYITADGNIATNGSTANCKAIHDIKIKLYEKTISVSVGGKTYDVEPDKIYGEIAKATIILANQTLVKMGKSPVYDVVVTYPAAFVHSDNPRLTTPCVETMRKSIEALCIDGNNVKVIKMLDLTGLNNIN
jgi:molecular chaperone DnaK (HSP70)